MTTPWKSTDCLCVYVHVQDVHLSNNHLITEKWLFREPQEAINQLYRTHWLFKKESIQLTEKVRSSRT